VTHILSEPVLSIALSILCFGIGKWCQTHFPSPLVNPLVIAWLMMLSIILVSPMTLEQYMQGGTMINMFSMPVTILLALKIYQQWSLLKSALIPVLVGCFAGALVSLIGVLGLCHILGIVPALTISLVPKSTTTAIAMELAEKYGGVGAIAAFAVLITGISSALLGPVLIQVLKLKDPVAMGVAMGVSGHVVGTAKALELGDVQGAMSGVAICLTGIFTSILCVVLL
jgi:putative effector of murein hydrolase